LNNLKVEFDFFGKKGLHFNELFFLEDGTMLKNIQYYQRVILLVWLELSAGELMAVTGCNVKIDYF
jgi:hypothetical protein